MLFELWKQITDAYLPLENRPRYCSETLALLYKRFEQELAAVDISSRRRLELSMYGLGQKNKIGHYILCVASASKHYVRYYVLC